MNILLCFNSGFYGLARALVISLMCHHEDLHFYVGYLSLTQGEIQNMQELVTARGPWDEGRGQLPKRDITFLPYRRDQADALPLEGPYTADTWTRCFIWEQIPGDRVLYLDSDMIVNRNLQAFYGTNFGNALIVASPDMGQEEDELLKAKERLGLSSEASRPYVNAGMVLFNLQGMREAGMTASSCRKYALEIHDKLRMQDQDFINSFFYGRIKFADPYVFNCQMRTLSVVAPADLPAYGEVDFVGGEQYERAVSGERNLDKVAILHFTARTKPIKPGYRYCGAEIFWHYAMMDEPNRGRYRVIRLLQRCWQFIKRLGL